MWLGVIVRNHNKLKVIWHPATVLHQWEHICCVASERQCREARQYVVCKQYLQMFKRQSTLCCREYKYSYLSACFQQIMLYSLLWFDQPSTRCLQLIFCKLIYVKQSSCGWIMAAYTVGLWKLLALCQSAVWLFTKVSVAGVNREEAGGVCERGIPSDPAVNETLPVLLSVLTGRLC